MCLPSVIIRVTLDMAGVILTAAGLGGEDQAALMEFFKGPRKEPAP